VLREKLLLLPVLPPLLFLQLSFSARSPRRLPRSSVIRMKGIIAVDSRPIRVVLV
jgi:hypothetical protein